METIKKVAKGIGSMLLAALCYVVAIILTVGAPTAVICFVVKWVLNV